MNYRPEIWRSLGNHDRHVINYRAVERAKKVIFRPLMGIWKGKGPDPRKVARENRLRAFLERLANAALRLSGHNR